VAIGDPLAEASLPPSYRSYAACPDESRGDFCYFAFSALKFLMKAGTQREVLPGKLDRKYD
jgi:hypothetical protein